MKWPTLCARVKDFLGIDQLSPEEVRAAELRNLRYCRLFREYMRDNPSARAKEAHDAILREYWPQLLSEEEYAH